MAKTYATTFDGLTLQPATGTSLTLPTATGRTQNARLRTYESQFTNAAQAVADQIVIAKPNSNEVFRSCSINISATLATTTLALQLNKIDGTTVTLSAATTYTTVGQTVEMVITNAALGTKLDGGEIVLVLAVAPLPGAGTVKTMVNTSGY
jgi:hypothetical protein